MKWVEIGVESKEVQERLPGQRVVSSNPLPLIPLKPPLIKEEMLRPTPRSKSPHCSTEEKWLQHHSGMKQLRSLKGQTFKWPPQPEVCTSVMAHYAAICIKVNRLCIIHALCISPARW